MSALEQRVVNAARSALADTKSVVPLDVLCRIGWLTQNHLDYWRQGRADYLEPLAAVRPEKLALVLDALHRWAEGNGLVSHEAAYVAATRDRRALRFTAAGDEVVERVFRTHWISPALPEKTRERLVARSGKPPDLLVIAPLKDWTCTGCGGSGEFLVLEDAGPLCMTCVDLDHLVFLPTGDATFTRRAKKESALAAVVVQWSRSRKRYERQGILVEEAAVERAEASCLADEEARLSSHRRSPIGRVRCVPGDDSRLHVRAGSPNVSPPLRRAH
ncbi:MAG: hypothetical protein ACRDRH_22360 [Pseudonocardia sp.]